MPRSPASLSSAAMAAFTAATPSSVSMLFLSTSGVRTSNEGLSYTDVARSTGHGFDVSLFAGFNELGITRSDDLLALVHGIRNICLVRYLSDDC
ncbi:hypothetical protein GW17_00014482 [Ensete ventricosum]|uniref:Uncharacterized protein n=1 Tax=Ensete ventricosum TaxID=4639 RepID=A0A426X5L9_ENSVE|nr:hypothetical protein B296_00032714 [Ensete ventricosum]RWW21377.1 hypothetical protein GW17_00014482 [Ensete ventricosum]RZS20695.1 hypothetical protein BHM03_00053249 [Ensete ventricosum]